MDKIILDYILKEKNKGFTDEDIKKRLINAGHNPKKINEYFNQEKKNYKQLIDRDHSPKINESFNKPKKNYKPLFAVIIVALGLFLATYYIALKFNEPDFIELGWQSYDVEDYQNAIKYFTLSIDKQPNAEAYYGIGKVNYKQNNFEEAIRNYKEAISINPSIYNYYLRLGISYYYLKDYDSAYNAINASLKLAANEYAFMWIGKVLDKKGLYNESEAYFLKAIDIKPSSSLFRTELGWHYYELGNYTAAQNQFEIAQLFNNKFSSAYNGLGWSYYELGKYKEAENAFKTALEIEDNREYYLGLAAIYLIQGKNEKAKTNLEYYNILAYNEELSDFEIEKLKIIESAI